MPAPLQHTDGQYTATQVTESQFAESEVAELRRRLADDSGDGGGNRFGA